MNKYRSRLLFAIITVIMIVLICLGIAVGHLFKSVYYHHFNQRMIKEVQLIARFIEHVGISNEEAKKEVKSTLELLDVKFGLLNANKEILYSNSPTLQAAIYDNEHVKTTLQTAKQRAGTVQTLALGEETYYYVMYVIHSEILRSKIMVWMYVNI